jgi:uncharacterized membrane protein
MTVEAAAVKVPVSCNGTSGNCVLTLEISATETLKGNKVIAITARATASRATKKVVVLGKMTVTLAAGQSETVTVKLNGLGTRLLAQYHRLKVRVAATEFSSGNMGTVASTTLTFAQPRAPRRHRH